MHSGLEDRLTDETSIVETPRGVLTIKKLIIMNINEIELASNLASQKLYNYSEGLNESDYNFEFPNGIEIETDEEVRYTEEAQDLFNSFYDQYLTEIENCRLTDES